MQIKILRVITGEKWYELMEVCATSTNCYPLTALGCSFSVSYAYFISFVLLMNVVRCAIFSFPLLLEVLNILQKINLLSPNIVFISLLTFSLNLIRLDRKLYIFQIIRGVIQHTDLLQALRKMEPPFGFGKYCPLDIAYRVLHK
ncbi:hypothetical protein MXB_4401 [Myxobolus squamalis]|nr:hypothetical protein MXB_4401 [Myxobolus squamalis]